jgi:hypothetical protein
MRRISAEKISTVAGPIEARKPLPHAAPAIGAVLFFRPSRHALRVGSLVRRAPFSRKYPFRLAREEICVMRQFGSLLRSTPSRIGRRLAQIFAIAAASLAAAGA